MHIILILEEQFSGKKARVSVWIFNVNNRFIHHRVVIAFMKAPLGNE